MDIIKQQIVEFYGDELTAVQLENGDIYVSVRHLCNALGLRRPAQIRRIKDTTLLNKNYLELPIQSSGGMQNTGMIKVELVPIWLSGLRIKAVKPELRERLEQYQEEAARVLWEAFQDGRLTANDGVDEFILSDPDNAAVQAYQMALAITKLARQQLAIEVHLQNQSEILEEHAVRLEQLEASLSEDATISDAQAAQLSQAVKAVALVLGKQTKRNEFPGVYGELYRRYDCSSYKLLKKKDFDSAMAWLNEWKGSLESDTF